MLNETRYSLAEGPERETWMEKLPFLGREDEEVMRETEAESAELAGEKVKAQGANG